MSPCWAARPSTAAASSRRTAAWLLGAGEQIGVDLRGDGLITLRVDRGAAAALAENNGLLQADGGRVELSAQGADALARATVNNTGLVQARGLVADGGSIRLVGDGDVRAGALDASSANGKGGSIAVAGSFVALDGAIDASGLHGGSVDVNAAATLSTAASTRATGSALDGGAVSYRSAGSVIESSSASVDASGATNGGSIGVQGDGGVLPRPATARAPPTATAAGSTSPAPTCACSAPARRQRRHPGRPGAHRRRLPGRRRARRRARPGALRDALGPHRAAGERRQHLHRRRQHDQASTPTGAAGQGGTAVIWSDLQTTMLGSVDARGAAAAGTVEISSKDELRHVGLERIALGSGGRLLLDPKNITIGSRRGSVDLSGHPRQGLWRRQRHRTGQPRGIRIISAWPSP